MRRGRCKKGTENMAAGLVCEALPTIRLGQSKVLTEGNLARGLACDQNKNRRLEFKKKKKSKKKKKADNYVDTTHIQLEKKKSNLYLLYVHHSHTKHIVPDFFF